MDLRSRHFLSLIVEVGPPVNVGEAEGTRRRYVPILGGRFSGGLEGRVLAGGADWQTMLPTGALEIDAHYALETEDGRGIEVFSKGVRHGVPEVLARLERGDPVLPADYYFRTLMRFRTPVPTLKHLNTLLAVASGEREKGLVRLTVFELL